jgi:radical SAM superfamily enzyme YgiQ (UPF0313 family)
MLFPNNTNEEQVLPTILMVDPGFGARSWGTFKESHWTSIIHQGLCGLSACLKENGQSDVHLADVRQLKDERDFDRLVREISPEIVAITMRSCDKYMTRDLAYRIRKVAPQAKIVVGGIHVSIDPDYCLDLDCFDYVVQGEGEITFVELVEQLGRGESPPRHLKGVPPDLDSLPRIDRELYPYHITINKPNYEGVFKAPMVTMLCSRGCAFNCSFCQPHARKHFGKKVRMQSPRNVYEELKYLHDKYRFNCVKFYDYTFTQYPKWVEEFCDLYSQIGKPFWVQSRADLVVRYPELISLLKKMGLKMIGIGFESGSDRVLRILRKGSTREINLQAAHIVKEAGVLLSGSFMLGIPGERRQDVESTVSMVAEMRPEFTSVSFFTPIPGNDLYDDCKENDLIINDHPETWVEFSPEIPKLKGMDYEYLKGAAARIMGIKFGSGTLGRLIRYFYVRTKYNYRLRRYLVFLYCTWVQLPFHNLLSKVSMPSKGCVRKP